MGLFFVFVFSQSSSTGISFPDFSHSIAIISNGAPAFTTWIAPSNGWILIGVYAIGAANQHRYFKINNIAIPFGETQINVAEWDVHEGFIPINRGDVITKGAYGEIFDLVFYPCK